MTEQEKQKLEDLKGKVFKYESKNYEFNDYIIKSSNIIIQTRSRTFNFLHSQCSTFLDEIQIIDAIKPTFKPSKSVIPSKEGNSILEKTQLNIYEPTVSQQKVQKALEDMLDKVKNSPEAIPQAKAVCEIANTMVNMEKSQIQLMNLAVKRNRG